MSRRSQVIQILPFGPVEPAELAYAAEIVRERFRCRAEVLPVIPLPASSWRPARCQYDADVLLECLFDRLPVDVMRLVGITEADLFADSRNFVFGYAHMRDRVAVFSTHRLREGYWGRPHDRDLLCSRIEKALVHELGHTFHAPHCEEPRCVMHQVEFLWQLDDLDFEYCARCERNVHTIVARGVDAPEVLFELAGSYMRRRRFSRAAATYAEAARRDPSNAHYHNDHGVALLALGDRAGAAQAFERAIRLAPQSPHAYYNLGILSRERADHRAADHFFAEALERDRDPLSALRYLGVLHQDYFGDAHRARRYFLRYRALGGAEPDVLRRLRQLMGEGEGRESAEESSLPAMIFASESSPMSPL